MKRYIKELANDLKNPNTKETNTHIDKIVRFYERGLITEFEAVREIIRTIDRSI